MNADITTTPSTAGKGTVTIKMGKTSDADFVYVDGHLYSNAITGKYVDYGDGSSIYDVSAVLDQKKGIANLLSKMTNPKAVGVETIDGVETTKITGLVYSTELALISGSRVVPQKGTPLPTTVWIANDGTHNLVQLLVTPAKDASITITLSKWGQQVSVTKPSVENTAPTRPSGSTPSVPPREPK